MPETKPLPAHEITDALVSAARYRVAGEPEVAESACLDILEIDPDNQDAVETLILARTDLLDRGVPGGVERARELLVRLTDRHDQAYFGALICERQARYLLRQRGARSGHVAYDWLRAAMQEYENAAAGRRPDRAEPIIRYNACVRAIAADPRCQPDPEERLAYDIE